MSDPATKYTSEPFKEQRQAWPALQRDMDPMPDCGERSYKGSNRLAGRKALVTGGDSGIGRAAVIAFAREGADVAINYHPSEEPDAQDVAEMIEAEGRKAVLLPGDLTDQQFCIDLVGQAFVHQRAISLFKGYTAANDPLGAFAAKTLPTLEAHYTKAVELAAKLQAGKVVQ